MSKFFSVDSPLYKFMNRLLDMLKLNAMWLLCSIPIVTMGAATTAAHYITLKMVDEEEGYIAEPFWKAFKSNLKQGSIIGVIMLVGIYAIYLDFQFYFHAKEGNILFLFIGIIGIFLLYMHMIYAFPLLARYDNTVINTMKNSYSIGIKFFIRTLFLFVILAIEVFAFLFSYTTEFLGILLGPACIILTISGISKPLFRRIEEENKDREAKEKEKSEEELDEGEELIQEKTTDKE